jgi:hypothetical protein
MSSGCESLHEKLGVTGDMLIEGLSGRIEAQNKKGTTTLEEPTAAQQGSS